MDMARRLRHCCEYAGAAVALLLARILPFGALCFIARRLASLAFALMRGRRETAIGNILMTGVARDRREAARIARESFASLALTVVESVTVPRMLASPARAARVKIDVDAPPETMAAFEKQGCGFMLVSAHLGNWELAAKVCSRWKQVTGIARRMDNPLVQALMERRGVRDGMRTIDKHDAHPMKIVRVLKRGGVLALLMDQHASGDSALTVDFLGIPARTYGTPAALQRLTGAPIVFGAAIRNGPLDFTLHFSEPVHYSFGAGTADDDILAATRDVAARLGDYIRRWPEQYLWAHRRWKAKGAGRLQVRPAASR